MTAAEIEALVRALPDWAVAGVYLTGMLLAIAIIVWVTTQLVAIAGRVSARREARLVHLYEVQRLYNQGGMGQQDFRRRRVQLVAVDPKRRGRG